MSDKIEFRPLKLVDFEYYMLEDDAPDYPMVIPVEFDLNGQLDIETWEQSFQKVAEAHPLLRARVKQKDESLIWTSAQPPTIEWVSHLPNMVFINLLETCGIKVFAKNGADRCVVKMFVHHSVADGTGICQIIEDWLRVYAWLKENPN